MVTVVWHTRAEKEYLYALRYGYLQLGERAQQNLQEAVDKCILLLIQNPYMGSHVPQLDAAQRKLRRTTVNRLFALVYYVDTASETVHIVSFWDIRK